MKHLLWRWRWREIRHGQLWAVVAALTLIVATVAALAMLATRIEVVMTQQGRAVLAADRVVVSRQPIADDLLLAASEQAEQVSQQIRFSTMAFSDNAMQLVSVKAVESAFPMRGDLQLATESEVYDAVQENALWLEPRLFDLLAVNVGEQVNIGDALFTVSGRIERDPELSFNPFNQMPTVLVHLNDVPRIGALLPGSRASYRVYFTGSDSQLQALETRFPAQPGRRWLSEETEGRTAELLVRAKQYLSLSLVLVVLMSAATLTLTCQHFAQSRRSIIAMLKSLGASQRWLRRWLVGQIVSLLCVSVVVGSVLGVGLEWALRLPLLSLFPDELPSVGIVPFVVAATVAILIAIPAMGIPLLRLLRSPAIAVLQDAPLPTSRRDWVLVLLPIIAGFSWFGSNLLVWGVLFGFVVMMLVMALLGWGGIWLMRKTASRPALVLALSRIKRSPWQTSMQMVALSSALMLLAVIWLLRSALLSDWQHTLPADAPNVFALNVEASQRVDYLQRVDDAGFSRSDAYPVIRGRLTAVGKTPIAEWVVEHSDGDEVRRRELNLTWFDGIPQHNSLWAGEWTGDHGVSIEHGIAERLGLALGDLLTFTVGSAELQAEITSIREVEWRNMHPNFYFIFPPEVMTTFPQTWLVSFKVIEDIERGLVELVRDFPTVTVLDLRTMVARVQQMLAQVSISLTMLAALGVLSGVLLIVTLLRLSLIQREREVQIYRTLGAGKAQIKATLIFEYGVLCLLAALLAMLGAELALAVVSQRLTLPQQWHPQLLLLPLLGGGLVLLSIGSITRRLLTPLK
ncbi:ABC transporter permease [Thaumasiovibrio sp. DFM-14]|uniref:ABC transporter permease n=1 Tax=Thaumasiovibrio sp. DFM-14 TaxID=3384792 RepID=UPI0039A384C2